MEITTEELTKKIAKRRSVLRCETRNTNSGATCSKHSDVGDGAKPGR